MLGTNSFAELYGDVQLKKKLQTLSRIQKRKAVRVASRQSAKPLLQRTKELAPKRTGVLKQSIKLRASRKSRVRVGVNIIIRKKDWQKYADKKVAKGKIKASSVKRYYASFVEFGLNKRHYEGRHFMKRAAEVMGRTVVKDFRRRLINEIRNIVR